MDGLISRVDALEERNRRVEGDKAWETSLTRRLLLTAFTYAIMGAYLHAIGVERPWLNALVPAAALLLSTLTLPLFKRLWMKH